MIYVGERNALFFINYVLMLFETSPGTLLFKYFSCGLSIAHAPDRSGLFHWNVLSKTGHFCCFHLQFILCRAVFPSTVPTAPASASAEVTTVQLSSHSFMYSDSENLYCQAQ